MIVLVGHFWPDMLILRHGVSTVIHFPSLSEPSFGSWLRNTVRLIPVTSILKECLEVCTAVVHYFYFIHFPHGLFPKERDRRVVLMQRPCWCSVLSRSVKLLGHNCCRHLQQKRRSRRTLSVGQKRVRVVFFQQRSGPVGVEVMSTRS